MEDPFKNLEQDLTHLLRAAVNGDSKDAADAQDPAAPPRRKRGGQPGNQNGRKHGFYAKFFTPEEQDALANLHPADCLSGEIDVLRVKIAGLLDQPDPDLNLLLQAVWVLARTARIDDRIRYGA